MTNPWFTGTGRIHTRARALGTLAGAALAAAALGQPSFQGLGDLPGGAFESAAQAVSADGLVVVGYGTGAFNVKQAFRWTATQGMVGLGFLAGGGTVSEAFGVSGNGSIVVGYSDSVSGIQGFRWTSGGMTGIGDLAGGPFGSAAAGVSLDGATIVGIGDISGQFIDGDWTGQAIRWTAATGVKGLGDLAGGFFGSVAEGVSGDGAIVVGTGDLNPSDDNVWKAWRRQPNGTLIALGNLPFGSPPTEAHAVSLDGSVVVGQGRSGFGDVAFRWQNGQMAGLGDFPGGAVQSEALACSADGSVVVGNGHDASGQKAFIWTPAGKLQDLKAVLTSKGLDLTGWTLRSATGVNGDGTVIVGRGINPQGKKEAWIARLAPACTTATTRASVGPDGQANGGSTGGSVTLNGMLVAFESAATNLVANDTNGRKDIFVRNRSANWTTRVSLTNAGFQANGDSWAPQISSKDGRYVVFVSAASNLVPGDTNGKADIFVRDRVGNTTTLISRGFGGVPANGASDQPQISADGRFIVFQSAASNLIQFDGNGKTDIFLWDRQNPNVLERVSLNDNGVQANNHCASPSVSNDGRFVAFASDASNLFIPDNNQVRDIFVRDRTLGKTYRVSVSSTGAQADGASVLPRISADGRSVAFTSSATNLVPGDTNGKQDVFVRDLLNQSTMRVSVGPTLLQPDADCELVAISSTGRFILYNSTATNLVPHDTNAARDAFLFDRWTWRTIRVSVGNNNQEAAAAAPGWGLSANGKTVVFSSVAGNLVPGDTGFSDVFVREWCK